MPGFSGQGKVLVGKRNTDGSPGLLRWVGNASVFKIAFTQDTVERHESYTGSRTPNRRLTKQNKAALTLTWDEFNPDNMALGLLGDVTAVAAGSAVTGWVTPESDAIVGSIIALPSKNVSAVAIKDSTPTTPLVLTAGVNYELDGPAGTFELLDITTGGPFIQPFKVDYTPGALKMVGAFKYATQELFVRFDGINTDDGSRCIVDLFRTRFSPIKNRDLISDDYNDFELDGTLLSDPTRLATSAEGQFYAEYYI